MFLCKDMFFKRGPKALSLVFLLLITSCGDQSLDYIEDSRSRGSSDTETSEREIPSLTDDSNASFSQEGSFLRSASGKKFTFNFPRLGSESNSFSKISSHYLPNGSAGAEIVFDRSGIEVSVDSGIRKLFSWDEIDPSNIRSDCYEVELHNDEPTLHLIITNCGKDNEDDFFINSENFIFGPPSEFDEGAVRWDDWVDMKPKLSGKLWSFEGRGTNSSVTVKDATLGH
jgi:hypothetical protein